MENTPALSIVRSNLTHKSSSKSYRLGNLRNTLLEFVAGTAN